MMPRRGPLTADADHSVGGGATMGGGLLRPWTEEGQALERIDQAIRAAPTTSATGSRPLTPPPGPWQGL